MGPVFRRRRHCSVCWTLVLVWCAWVNGEAEIVKAKAGSSVTLKSSSILENQTEQILWTFGAVDPSLLITKVSSSNVTVLTPPQFEDRLNVDQGTGDLTISKLSLNDTGVYQQQRIGKHISSKQFKLEVYSPLSLPSVNIKSYPLQVECSVENSRNLTLTWFKGKVWLQRMSSSGSAGLSLPLNLEQSETHEYICEARNPLEKMSTSFHPKEMCLKNGESSNWCHSELTVRLVLSAVIGLVLMVFVADHLQVIDEGS